MNITESLLTGLIDNHDILYDYGCLRSHVTSFMKTPMLFSDRQRQAMTIIEEILSAHGKESLLGHLSQLAHIELHAGGLQPRARDHVVHALLTFILGAYINEHFLDIASRADIFQWKLAAMMHDIAYPVEIAHRIILSSFEDTINGIRSELGISGCQVKFLIVPENIEKLSNHVDGFSLIQNRLDDWGLAINAKRAYREMLSSGEICHGMLSGLVLLYVLDLMYQKHNPSRAYADTRIPESNINWSQCYFEEDIVSACASVFLHNLKAKHFSSAKISRSKAPLAFLLRLSDSLQDWERPSMNDPHGTPARRYDIRVDNRKLIFECDIPEERKLKIEDEIFGALDTNDVLIR